MKRYIGRVLPPVIFMLLLPIAFAAVSQDRADNSLTFVYEAEDDEITGAASSVRHSRGDLVDFITTVADADGATPLAGKITLRLIGRTPVTYNGTFTFVVTDADGNTAFTESQVKKFTLRPKVGKRTQRLRFGFDLPSGEYSVRAKFAQLSEA